MGQDTCGGRHEDNMGLGSLFTTRVPGVTQVLRRSPLPPPPPSHLTDLEVCCQFLYGPTEHVLKDCLTCSP